MSVLEKKEASLLVDLCNGQMLDSLNKKKTWQIRIQGN